MKKNVKILLGMLVLATSLTVVGCKSSAQKENTKSEREMTEVIYTCPMHPEVEQKEPGNCPECGMALVEKKSEIEHLHEEHM
ncbi:MAG: hypothetical protein JXK95_16420 [Bacteroidales bacterium]|nr:hypothetical protein [Bacteroidales bacterium]